MPTWLKQLMLSLFVVLVGTRSQDSVSGEVSFPALQKAIIIPRPNMGSALYTLLVPAPLLQKVTGK